jgi:transposase
MESYLQGTYNKIPDTIRDRLAEMVVVERISIKDAATSLKLKYSTAKTIYKIFKKENRTFKYSSRSRNPGATREMIKRIQKAPLPSFLVKRTVN